MLMLCLKNLLRNARHGTSRSASGGLQSTTGVPYQTTLKDQVVENKPQNVPSSADVVIIGGGSVGCSTLYHLSTLGTSNCVLLERNKLTSGTTWHTAGLVWRLRPNDIEIQLLNHTRDLLERLEEETGVYPGWINNGGLFIASRKERLDEYKRLMTIGKAFGVDSHVLSPAETSKIHPLINIKDVYGTLYSPGDGTVDPAGFCTSLTRGAKQRGAKVFEECPVLEISTEPSSFGTKKITGVTTPYGHIKTNTVVNCTGVWARNIGRMVGVDIPLIPMKHAYIVTETIAGIENTPNIRDHDASVYFRLQGDALSIGGYESNPIFLDDVPNDFAFGLYELDWDVFGVHIEQAINRVPVLERTGIKSTVCGPESFTPDHKPLMGEEPLVHGFFHGCGFNSAGMMLGGGCGRELARWVINGRPELDMYSYDVRRFTPQLTSHTQWVKERSHEAYAKNYSTVFLHDESLAARNIKLDPFHEILEKQGCVFQERLGWERPGWFKPNESSPLKPYDYYGSYGIKKHTKYEYYDRLKEDYTFDFPSNHDVIRNECLTCRNSAVLFNMSYFGKYFLTGPDAQKAADYIFSNNVDLGIGKTVYTCMLNKRGGIEADLTVSIVGSGTGTKCDPEFEGRGFYVAAGGGAAYQNWSHIMSVVHEQKYDINLADHSEDMGLLSLQGPKSREILQSLTPTSLANDNFPFSTNQSIEVAGHRCLALRLTFVGELGWELHIPKNSCVPVYKALMEAGKQHGLINAGYRAIDSMSIEKGYRHWHADVRSDDNPIEAGLGFTCKLKIKTDFLGREAVETTKQNGVQKRIACFTLDEKVPLWGLEAIWRDDEQVVGYLRRADYGFAIDKSIGYGYIRHPDGIPVTLSWLKSGRYGIEVMGERYGATLHPQTPFDPTGDRIRGIYQQK